jgi:hypothetical protein
MIRTLSTASSDTSCSSTDHQSPSSHTRRFTLHSIATRFSDSKKHFFDHIPHQQQLTRFRKRAKNFLSTTLIDQLTDTHLSKPDRRNSSSTVYKSIIIS